MEKIPTNKNETSEQSDNLIFSRRPQKSSRRTKKLIGIGFFFVVLVASGIFFHFYKTKNITQSEPPKTERQLVYENLLEKTEAPTLPFIKNAGQKDGQVKFYAPIENGTVYVNETGITYDTQPTKDQGLAIQEKLIGLDHAPVHLAPEGEKPSETDVNYFIGNNPEAWQNNLDNYAFINFKEVYPKIEFKVRATQKNIEKLFIVDTNGNPNDIRLGFDGIDKLEVTEHGELKLDSKDQSLILTAPQAYQYQDGKKKYIAVTYELEGDNTYGFKVENYDSSKMLVIDPMIASTLIGGSEEERFEFNSSFSAYTGRPNMVQDTSGNIYIVGHTRSADYPTTLGAYDRTFNDADPNFGNDIVISKFDPTLTTLIASTYLGGTDEDNAFAIALDSSNNVYVTGYTKSTNFPMAGTPYQSAYQGGTYDTFIAKLSNDLTSLTNSTYLGGNGEDHAITMLISGTNLYLAGDTNSGNFPTTSGTVKTAKEGTVDGFISQLNLNLSTLTSSTFFGGNNDDYIKDIDIYNSNLYITGYTNSTTDLASGTAYSSTYGGGTSDAFVASINTSLTTTNQSTYLGGTSLDYGIALDIDSTGRVIVTGSTQGNFTTTAGVYDTSFNSAGQYDGFVSILTTNLSTLTASTYIGGNGSDELYDVITDPANNIFVSGYTTSTDYPANNALRGAGDGLITKFNSNLTQLTASTLIGGTSNIDKVFGLDFTSDGKVLASGITDSTNFPTTTGAYQQTNMGKRDIFLTKLDSDLIISQTPHHLQLTIGETDTPTIRAGVSQNLVIEAKDPLNGNLINYDGDHTVVLSGAVNGPNGAVATCNGVNFGSNMTVSFTDGSATCTLLATKANNTQSFDAQEIGGNTLSTAAITSYDLSPVVNPGVISAAQSSIDTSNDSFSAGSIITVNVTPYDMYQNSMGALGNVDLPVVNMTITGSNPGIYNGVAFNSGSQSFAVTYAGTIAGHDYVTAAINAVSVGRDSDPSTLSPYDGSNGIRNILGFDHLELTVAGASTLSGIAGQAYALQIWTKNSLRETLINMDYGGGPPLTLSGAVDSPYGFKATGANIDFGSVIWIGGVTKGQMTANIIIKGAQTGTSIEATYNGRTSTADPAYDLDLNITPAAADHLNLREVSQTAYHNDVINKDAAQATNIIVSARDQFGNIDPTYTGSHNILFTGPTNSYGKSGTGGTIPTVNGDTNAFSTATPNGTGTSLNFTSGETASTPMVLYAKGTPQIDVSSGSLNSWSSGYPSMNFPSLDLDMNISSTGTLNYTNSEITSQYNPNGTCGGMSLLVITRDQYGNQLEGEHSSGLTINLTFDPTSTNNAGITVSPLTNMANGSYSYSYVAFPGLDKVTGTINTNPIVSDSYPATPITGDLGSDGTYLQQITSGYNKRTWTGAVSTDWNNAGNWLEGSVPLYCSYVIIARSNYVGTNCAGAVCQPTINLSAGTKEVQGLYLGKNFDPFAASPFDINTTPATYHNIDADSDANLTLSQGSLTNYLKVNGDLVIYEKGLVTHTANTTTQTHIVNIEVGGNMTMQASDLDSSGIVDADEKGEIDVSSKGFYYSNNTSSLSYGPGAGTGGGFSGSSGGGYGGSGGLGQMSTGGNINGSLTQPSSLGSSGGGFSTFGLGGSGGGAVKLTISGATTMNGSINVNGQDYSGSYGPGGGSGGSVWLTTGTLVGTGTISSKGGSGRTAGNAGGGGGGRIAVYYTTDTSSIAYQAYGGAGYGFGGAGTIYKKVSANTYGDLIVDNNNQDPIDDRFIGKTPISETIDFNSVTVQNYGYLNVTSAANIIYSTLNWSTKGIIADNGGAFSLVSGGGNLVVPATSRLIGNIARTFTGLTVNGILTHSNNFATEQYKLDYTVNGDCIVNVGGAIDVSYKGYQHSEGPGQGINGNSAGGGSYGGQGGSGNGAAAGPAYGSSTQPIDLGSGGGDDPSHSATAGAGGGAIKLTTSGVVTLSGSINAKGANYYDVSTAGGGSGGGIWLTTDSLTGTGTMAAIGGNGYSSGGGSGGRIAVYYTTDTSSIAYQAYGGAGVNIGGAGTIYKKVSSATYGDIIIDNNNQNPPDTISPGRTTLVSGDTFNKITIRNYGSLDIVPSTNVNYSTLDWSNKGVIVDSGGTFSLISGGGNLTVPSTSKLVSNVGRNYGDVVINGTLTNYYNTTTQQYVLNIAAANLTIASGGTIDVSSKGFYYSNNTSSLSYGPGAGTGGGFSGSSGGGYGGSGGLGQMSTGGNINGSLTQPSSLGSSGGGFSTFGLGGSGGGAVKLTISGATTMNGSINVNGQDYSGSYGPGGGSGGSVWLTTGTLVGTGTISSKGGSGRTAGNAGGGGGGRIAVYYTTDTSSLNYQAYGGSGYNYGGAGTIYLADTDNPENNKLIIDNNGQNGPETWLGYNSTETISLAKLHLTNYAKVVVKSGATIDFSHVNNIINDFTPTGSYLYHEAGNVIFNPDTTITGFTFMENSGASFTHNNLTIGNGGIFEQANYYYTTDSPLLFNNLTIANGGKLTHSQNTTEANPPVNAIYVKANDFNIQSGGMIDVSGRGWNTNGSYSGTLNSGAGHGGIGGQSTTGTGGAAYDSGLNPTFPGSRGYAGGPGGGAARIIVDNSFTNNGDINANATNGTINTGGGSGGSILISAKDLNGGGNIYAKGGNTTGTGGSGSGGRIAIYYENKADYGGTTPLNTANYQGGTGGNQSGSIGTFYMASADHYAITGNATEQAGTVNLIAIYLKDQNNNNYIYDGTRTLTFSGANPAPNGTNPTCSNNLSNNINFNSPVDLNFTSGQSSSNMILYAATAPGQAEIETQDGTFSTTGDPAWDLDVTVNPGAVNPNQALLSGTPNPINITIQPTETISVLVRDQYQNNIKTGTETVITNIDLGNNGSIDQSNVSMTDPDLDGVYTITYNPLVGTDLITAKLNGSVIAYDNDGTSDGNLYINADVSSYTLTYNTDSNGTITGTNPQTVDHGANGTEVIAIPNPGYHFIGWSDNYSTAARTDINVTSDITVTANFAINTYSLTYNHDSNGSITGTIPQTVNYGQDGTAVTAVPNPGYHFTNWSDSSTSNPRTDSNVTQNINITASFSPDDLIGSGQLNVSANVESLMTFSCDPAIDLGPITPGTPNTGAVTCTTTTNNTNGYTISVKKDKPITLDDGNGTDITDKTAWNNSSPNSNAWTGTGLGFRLTQTGTTSNYSPIWWGNDDTTNNAKFAGFPTDYQTILANDTYSATATDTILSVKLNVPATQKTGDYAGTITVQVVVNP